MASKAEEEEEASLSISLPLLSIRSTMESPERPWMSTSPVHTTVSVPFHWEQEPGKPKIQCKNISDVGNECVLKLPPRLLFGAKNSELISPKCVLDESYVLGRLKFQSSSFRMARECNSAGNRWSSPDIRQLGDLGLSKRWDNKDMEKGLVDSLGMEKLNFKEMKEINMGSCVFPSSVYRENDISGEVKDRVNVKLARFRRSGSVPLPKPKSHFLTTIYENLKRAVPWRRRKSKKICGSLGSNGSPLSDTRSI